MTGPQAAGQRRAMALVSHMRNNDTAGIAAVLGDVTGPEDAAAVIINLGACVTAMLAQLPPEAGDLLLGEAIRDAAVQENDPGD